MESVKDVQGGDVCAGEAGLHGGRYERPGSGAGVRAATGHREEDAQVFSAVGIPATQGCAQAEAGAVHRGD